MEIFRFLPLTLLLSLPALALEVHGHRGARAAYPENSIPAFEYALQQGVDVLEMDVGVSRDGVLVVAHDPYINSDHCLNADGSRVRGKPLLYTLSLKEIQSFDCGSLPHPDFPQQKRVPGTRIPTLSEVFEFVKSSSIPRAKTVRFNIETKIFPDHPEWTPDPEAFSSLVVDTLKKHQMTSRTLLQSFDDRTLKAARNIEPFLKISILVQSPVPGLLKIAAKLQPDVVSPHWKLVTPNKVLSLHTMAIQVVPWTVNEIPQWESLIDMGVDGIITDDPARLIQYLRSKGQHK